MPVHVGIKRGERQPTEFYGIAVLIFPDNDVRARLLILELNFIAHEFDVLPAGRIGGIRRNHEQSHTRAFLATDHLDDFVQPHLANIDKVSLCLRYGGDSVAYFKPSIHLRGPSGNEALDFCVAILGAKHRADPHEREAHVDAEILHVGLAQVLRVRVVCLGKRIEKEFHLLVLILLVDVAGETIVTARNQLRARLNRMFA